jgi:hypothetical protein
MKFVMQSEKVPHMSFPQERQLKEQRKKVKRKHDTRIPKVED